MVGSIKIIVVHIATGIGEVTDKVRSRTEEMRYTYGKASRVKEEEKTIERIINAFDF